MFYAAVKFFCVVVVKWDCVCFLSIIDVEAFWRKGNVGRNSSAAQYFVLLGGLDLGCITYMKFASFYP